MKKNFHLIWALKQLFVAAPLETVILFVFVIIQGLTPAASLYAIQGIIQWITISVEFPIFFTALWGSLLLADIILTPVVSIVRLHLNEKMLCFCNLLLMKKANSIKDLNSFENPKLYDEIQYLKNESSRRPLNLIYVLTRFLKDGIALISVLAMLYTLEWWIPVAMVFASLPHALSTLWFEKQSWDQMLFRSPESRKLSWLASLTLDDQVAKEVRLFGFGDFLMKRYQELSLSMHHALSGERWRKSICAILLSSLTVFGYIFIISMTLWQTKGKAIEISSLVIVIQSLIMTQSQMTSCISYLGMMTPIHLFFTKLRSFLYSSHSPISEKASKKITEFNEICFQSVSFSYPNGREVLSKVSFKIHKGEKIAIVGQNGAGKSTLVKLLLRFYDPTEGTITVDGYDLKSLDVMVWRSLVSGVFQDFGRYHFTMGENISLGNINASDEKILGAAKKGGFYPILKNASHGIHTS